MFPPFLSWFETNRIILGQNRHRLPGRNSDIEKTRGIQPVSRVFHKEIAGLSTGYQIFASNWHEEHTSRLQKRATAEKSRASA
jgi:hypothetical protein